MLQFSNASKTLFLSAINPTLRKKWRVRSFSGPYFPVFRLNMKIDFVNLFIPSKGGKIRTRKTPNKDTFHTMLMKHGKKLVNTFIHKR